MAQEALFYSFNLERHVPAEHLLRSINRFVDLSDIREQLRPFYSETGRPSIDPELMIRMLIIGYCMGGGWATGIRRRQEDQGAQAAHRNRHARQHAGRRGARRRCSGPRRGG